MESFLEPTQEAGRAFFMRGISGTVVMLNLLRFRKTADYSSRPGRFPLAAAAGRLMVKNGGKR
jgi:hypothetical protein